MEPRLARCLVSSIGFGCSADVLTIAAMCCVDNPFVTSKEKAGIDCSVQSRCRLIDCKHFFRSDLGDHLALLNVYNGCERANFEKTWCESHCVRYKIMNAARDVRSYLQTYFREISEIDRFTTRDNESYLSSILRSFVTGYFANAAQFIPEGCYRTFSRKQYVKLHPTSVFSSNDFSSQPPEWVIYHELEHMKRPTVRIVSKVDPKWFLELSSKYYGVQSFNSEV